ncbi:MAG: bifunctional transaldolase/phosoglucose isomerase [Thermoplasmata archaeon]|nr:bifunctional transaldolase/phosoglucose isomerase [Thermoplasmata archaeon]
MTRLAELLAQGQSPWLDYIRRSLLTSGDLQRMVEVDGITGVTINPTIFEKAIAGSHDYDSALATLLAREPDLSPAALYERLAVEDVTLAADVLRPVYDRTGGQDGFVSLEVAPGLAHDTEGTVAEARRLWKAVHRPNLLIKVPGTKEGVPAIERLISEGINVNVTLLFSLSQYEDVAQAYLRGAARAPNPARIASVASVFVSRIDTAVDRILAASTTPAAKALQGKVAVANCRVIYARFQELMQGPGFAEWRARWTRPQRVLWASTSTKDPAYRDTMYVEELVGPETVDTIPPATLTAFEDHGVVRGNALARGATDARRLLQDADACGVDLGRITDDLQVEGVASFAASYALLLRSLESKKEALRAGAVDRQSASLGSSTAAVATRLADWQSAHFGERFWRADPTLWPEAPAADVTDRMGWLLLPELMRQEIPRLTEFAEAVRAEGIRSVVLLGMGGSSLAPEVFRGILGSRPGFPELLVLDSTHPQAVSNVRQRIDPRHTLFVVSSKSGTTIEPLSFCHYFWEEVRASGNPPGPQFMAVTDPGTPLEKFALEQQFRAVFQALPTVGGRYSALTMFGLVPAALLGTDVAALLDQAETMAVASAASVPAGENPGLRLGAALGEVAVGGRDKLTFYASPGFAPLPSWIEQLVAESTGKIGKGIVPVVDEPMVGTATYGADRFFVEIQEAGNVDPVIATHTARLEAAGHPVVRIQVPDRLDLGQEFFRWEMGVASAGQILGINPFDQPDVELAKDLARSAMAHPGSASTPDSPPTIRADDGPALTAAVGAWLALCQPGDYVGIQAYLAPSDATWGLLQGIRQRLLERRHVATTLGYGPHFLHSTGQLHKGGPNIGLFLQLVDDAAPDVEVPGQGYTFGQLIQAQSVGDAQALEQKHRRLLRVHLGSDVLGGLQRLTGILDG